MINLVHFDEQRVDNIVMDQFEILVAYPVFHVAFSTRKKIVHHYDLVPIQHQPVYEMGTYESGAACNLKLNKMFKNPKWVMLD